jgi:alpha-N-arabinofuranosidase
MQKSHFACLLGGAGKNEQINKIPVNFVNNLQAVKPSDEAAGKRMSQMQNKIFVVLFALFGFLRIGCLADEVKTFQNPIISGFYPDPSICRVGDDYYTVHSSFEYFPGVPIFHSKDLVHWGQIGYCLTSKSQLNLEHARASGGIYAPTLRYHNGTFYMITTLVDAGGNFFVTATNPAGPWSEPVWVDRSGMDPSLLFDDDGKVYYTRHEGQGDGYIAQAEIDIKTGKLTEPVKKIWGGAGGVWVEGPHLYKINGKYFLMVSEGGTSYDHRVTVARSDSPWGPFESDTNNPILTHRFLYNHPIQVTGHADLVETPHDWRLICISPGKGNRWVSVETPHSWWLVCLGVRPQGGRYHHIGRETFLAPVAFNKEGWPVVNENKPIELTMPAPKLPEYKWPKLPTKDDFKSKTLALEWNYLRNPVESEYSLTERHGFLRLYGSDVNMSDQDSPAFVGRRQTDFDCVASTRVEFNPNSENEEAGLVVRGNDRHHYDIAVTLKDGKRQVSFRKVFKGNLVEPVKYTEIQNGPVVLTVKAAPLSYEFFCQSKSGKPVSLGTAPTKDLSVEAIGFDYGMCFTGVYFGMYATGNGKKCTRPADFDWFEYRATEK